MSGTDIQKRLHLRSREIIENSILTEAILFPEIYRHYLAYRAMLDQDQAELHRLRRRRLDAQLRHASIRVPVYRGLDAAAPIESWPFATKAALRDRLADFCDDAIDPQRCRSGRTSGTTGIPIKVIHDFEQIAHKYALALRRNDVTGLPMRRRILTPMRDGDLPWIEYPSPGQGNSIIAQFGSAGADGQLMDRVRHFAPDVISGHPSNCVRFVEAVRAASVAISPSLTVTYGERLDRTARERLGRGLGTSVRDGYGMREFGTVAVQCADGGYHVESERLLVEIIDDDGRPAPPGQPGEVVITDLVNRAMPLIRYRTGDTARLATERCPCGYPGDLLSDIYGRDVATIPLFGGTVPLNALTRVIRRYPLRRFQIVQRATAGALEVLLSVNSDAPAHTVAARLSADLSEFIGDADAVTVVLVGDGDFLPAASGKDSDFVSLA